MEKFKQFYEQHPTLSLVILSLTIWPIGMYLLWKRPNIAIWIKGLILVVILIYGIFMLAHLDTLNQTLKGL